jgi:hypothetical protein
VIRFVSPIFDDVQPNPPGEFPEQAGAAQKMDIVVKYLAHESTLFWSRSQFFLAANAGLFGLLAIAFRDSEPGTLYELVVLATACIVGLTITFLWFKVLKTGGWWMDYWTAKVCVLEGYAMGDLEIFRRCHEARIKANVSSARAVAKYVGTLFTVVWMLALAFAVVRFTLAILKSS